MDKILEFGDERCTLAIKVSAINMIDISPEDKSIVRVFTSEEYHMCFPSEEKALGAFCAIKDAMEEVASNEKI